MKTKFLMAIWLVAISSGSWADDRCSRSADAQTAVWISLKDASPSSSDQFEAQFEIDNRGASDVWLDVIEHDGKRFISDAQVLFQFPDVNGQWVTWLTAPGTFIGPKSPARLRAGASQRLRVSLPPNELFLNFHGKSRVLFRFARSKSCAASEPFQAILDKGQVTAFRSSW
jgi:hypothetical protein